MITEQRLRFEAKHKVPDDIVYSYETKSYVAKARHYGFSAPIYNTLWQGYQSALEDRQGEAVRYERLHPTQGWIIVEEQDIPHYREQGQQIRPLFTSPQPAQPDQWNAAIEAAAELAATNASECPKCKGKGTTYRSCSMCGDSTYDHECDSGHETCIHCNGTGKVDQLSPRILALRKGA